MGADDDLDCLEHDWVIAEADLTARGATQVSECSRCQAVRYEPSQAARRPRL